MTTYQPIRVLFVCAGNICRSPMAEAVFRYLVARANLTDRFEIASVGTGGWHIGERAHPGTQAILQRYGIDIGDKRAIQLTRADFEAYDYLIAMDAENLDEMHRLSPDSPKVRRLLEFAPESRALNVPDPYYSGGFEQVYALVTAGCQGLLAHIREREGL
jgi:protein-tyrosine phosphatase